MCFKDSDTGPVGSPAQPSRSQPGGERDGRKRRKRRSHQASSTHEHQDRPQRTDCEHRVQPVRSSQEFSPHGREDQSRQTESSSDVDLRTLRDRMPTKNLRNQLDELIENQEARESKRQEAERNRLKERQRASRDPQEGRSRQSRDDDRAYSRRNDRPRTDFRREEASGRQRGPERREIIRSQTAGDVPGLTIGRHRVYESGRETMDATHISPSGQWTNYGWNDPDPSRPPHFHHRSTG